MVFLVLLYVVILIASEQHEKITIVETICWVVAKFVTKYCSATTIVVERKICTMHVLGLSLYE
jgi:hypothetical protein